MADYRVTILERNGRQVVLFFTTPEKAEREFGYAAARNVPYVKIDKFQDSTVSTVKESNRA